MTMAEEDRKNLKETALDQEISRILALESTALYQEVARMAASWIVELGTDLWGDGGSSGVERIAMAYQQRLAREDEQSPDVLAMSDADPVGEAAYLALLRRILDHGTPRTDRTGTGTYSLFGAQLRGWTSLTWSFQSLPRREMSPNVRVISFQPLRFDLRQGFPLVTTKRVPFSSIIKELLWFLRGSTNITDLGCGIWDAWADEHGEVGPVYGYQWRRWGASYQQWLSCQRGAPQEKHRVDESNGIDQLLNVIETIRTNPDSRRIIISAWNVTDLPQMRLPPCHLLFQFYVDDGCLDMQLYQRSADMAIGVPFNIASYALLLSMIAAECHLAPRYFVHTFGDAHIYANHVEGVRLQLSRAPLPSPRLQLSDKPVLAQTLEDVRLVDYQHHPAIRFEVSV